ncbi:potassium channel subfamily K member 18 isoform X2 [Periplaneta americana]|uniref:potassium channel subfamily K member 18 isoform X2 n=1 Tax=Periplaneta americana TaxID=6978 RepID=UPI0037E793CE
MSSPTDAGLNADRGFLGRGEQRIRPRLTLPILRISGGAPNSPVHTPTMVSIPMTPAGGIPIAMAGNHPLGMLQVYPNKASEFMFKQFEGFKDFTMNTAKSGLSVGEKVAFWLYAKVRAWSRNWFTHIFLFLVVLSYSLIGAAIFVAVEGSHEIKEQANIRRERYALIRQLRELTRDPVLAENDEMWEGRAVDTMRDFEDVLLESFRHGVTPQQNDVWSFWNAVFYCGTIYTTIGYGHISPSTTTGRAITIVYAIFGIPMFLILLADFGKLFTRGIKFIWAFVRRVYYTGSCKKVRRTVPVQEVMKGVQLVYDFATFRRPSQMMGEVGENARKAPIARPEDLELQVPLNQPQPAAPPPPPPPQQPTITATNLPIDGHEPPGTPALSTFEVDDEFNLPISVAIVILLIYIFVGATIYWTWENWGFFESFYFVFISMSTIGFGDFVPQHPMYMMASIVYLVFGLALTSMCINVVQEKLSDSFRQASAKIGATIGLKVNEEDGTITPVPPVQIELPEVHNTITKSQST